MRFIAYLEDICYSSLAHFVGELTAAVTSFPQQVVIALAHVMKYLATFNVADALLETRFFTKFTERTHMLLNGNTLTNLCVLPNSGLCHDVLMRGY